jgi:hypothetical protein
LLFFLLQFFFFKFLLYLFFLLFLDTSLLDLLGVALGNLYLGSRDLFHFAFGCGLGLFLLLAFFVHNLF